MGLKDSGWAKKRIPVTRQKQIGKEASLIAQKQFIRAHNLF
jgi:hypothetical protein